MVLILRVHCGCYVENWGEAGIETAAPLHGSHAVPLQGADGTWIVVVLVKKRKAESLGSASEVKL